jgi:hypothetical protein
MAERRNDTFVAILVGILVPAILAWVFLRLAAEYLHLCDRSPLAQYKFALSGFACMALFIFIFASVFCFASMEHLLRRGSKVKFVASYLSVMLAVLTFIFYSYLLATGDPTLSCLGAQ